MHHDITTEVRKYSLGPGHIVLDGDPALPTERGTAAPPLSLFTDVPSLRPYKPRPMSVVAKQLDGSMPLGMEVGLGPGDIVLDGD